MSDYQPTITLPSWAPAVLMLVGSVIPLGALAFALHSGAKLKREAVEHGYAYYAVDVDGQTTFTWKTKQEVKQP